MLPRIPFASLQVVAVLAAMAATHVASSASSRLPSVDITLTPNLNAKNTSIDGRITLEGDLARNETLIVLPITMARQLSAQYTNKTLEASDRHGPLGLNLDGVIGSDG
ncbi:hypothetical protein B0T10DRAFT_462571 [Thelonectria olida]|uniref:Uncharacterized protein n=1 Tax=Thelonectria olida TaxID=1576542 RepID=A0A9P8VZ65_9HYPO|nr:hypothetical protein B0T10DRAFT_462571 [Thelonectria olida]